MANPAEISALESRINTIGLAMCFGAPAIVAAVIWLVLEPRRSEALPSEDAAMFQYALLAIALIEIPIGLMLKRRGLAGQLKRRYQGMGPTTPEAMIKAGYVTGFGAITAAAAYALIVPIVGGDIRWATAMLLIPPAGYLIIRPKGGEIEAALKRLVGK